MEDRNRNYASIMRNLNFSSRGWYDVQSQTDELDDHVKRKVSSSPGLLHGCGLLQAGVTGQSRAVGMAVLSAAEECSAQGWLVYAWLFQLESRDNVLHCAGSPMQRGAAQLLLDQGRMASSEGCTRQIAC